MIGRRHARMAVRFAAHRFRTLHPYEVQLILLNACNLKCVYCRCPEIATPLLTTAQWLEVIRRLGSLGTIRVKFQGGEPTLRADFLELCAAARRGGMITAVVTNGLPIARKPELLDELDEVVVSLDAVTPEVHERLRGPGTHAQVVRAIDLARARGLPTYVVMVVTRENFHEIEPMLRFCEARGLSMNAQPVVFGRPAFDDRARPIALDGEQIRSMHRQMVEWKRAGRPLMFSAPTYQRVADWPDHDVLTVRSGGESSCMAGKFYAHIEANGDVIPCQQHGSTLEPKNVIRDGLEEALRHAQRHDCGDCFAPYLNERKALFALRPHALREILRR